MRIAISVEERVAITLKFLATGESYFSISQLFRVSPSSICNIITEVCEAIYNELKDEFLQVEFLTFIFNFKSFYKMKHGSNYQKV